MYTYICILEVLLHLSSHVLPKPLPALRVVPTASRKGARGPKQ